MQVLPKSPQRHLLLISSSRKDPEEMCQELTTAAQLMLSVLVMLSIKEEHQERSRHFTHAIQMSDAQSTEVPSSNGCLTLNHDLSIIKQTLSHSSSDWLTLNHDLSTMTHVDNHNRLLH